MVLPIPLAAPTLCGSLVKMQQLDGSFLQNYLELLGDEGVIRWTGITDTPSPKQISDWLSTRADQNDRLDWAIIELESGEFAGEIVLNELDAANSTMNLRIAIRSKFQNQGLGTEAMRLACDYCLDVIGLEGITLGVMTENLGAQRSYEKLGFKQKDTYLEDGVSYLEMTLRRKDFLDS
jgi:RimJ/RimL family protein N-acetyltransferase